MRIAKRVASISPSATLAIDARAKQMKAEGMDVIGFGVGEPDFDTPEHIKNVGMAAIRQGKTKYTPAAGILDLKKAICAKLQQDNGLHYEPAQIVVSCGAKQSLYNCLQALVEEGDEVLLPAPYWVSYLEQIQLAGGVGVIVPTDESTGFKVTPALLANYVTPKTRGFILNSPSNPTGALYSRQELSRVAEFVVQHDLFVLSDEIYEKLVYVDEPVISIATFGEEIKQRTVIINGVSKAYAMTGWRIGYTAGDAVLAKAMTNLQSHSATPTSISQYASVAALTEDQQPVEDMRQQFAKRRDLMVARLQAMEGIQCATPPGAFYVFPHVGALLGKRYQGQIVSDVTMLCELLLTEARIALVPGTAFGAPNNLRISYANSMENIQTGMDRLEEFLRKLC